MSTSSALLAVRIDAQAIELLEAIAKQDQATPATVVERLIFREAESKGLLAKDDPALAFMALLDETANYLRSRRFHGEDVTLEWFRALKADPRLLTLHAVAVQPPNRKITAEKRRQYVHQRIGRFVKEFLGRESGKEVSLPRTADELIRSYTKLVA